MADSLTITTEAPADKATAPAAAKDDGKGGVTLDTTEALAAAAAAKTAAGEPGLILGKFKTQADLEAAYAALEKKQGEKPAAPVVPPTPEAAAKAVKDAGLDMAALSNEVAENGELSAESLKALSDKGITEEVAKTFIEGQKALGAQLVAEIQGAAGGAEQYTKLTAWAQANLTDEEVVAYNDAINSGNKNLAKLAVTGLAARHTAAVGKEGSLVEGESVPVISGIKGFESQAEIVAAMRDPRYKNGDTAYIEMVEARTKKSKVFGA